LSVPSQDGHRSKLKEESESYSSRTLLQTTTPLDAIEEFKIDAYMVVLVEHLLENSKS
jgi:hypothetical protein